MNKYKLCEFRTILPTIQPSLELCTVDNYAKQKRRNISLLRNPLKLSRDIILCFATNGSCDYKVNAMSLKRVFLLLNDYIRKAKSPMTCFSKCKTLCSNAVLDPRDPGITMGSLVLKCDVTAHRRKCIQKHQLLIKRNITKLEHSLKGVNLPTITSTCLKDYCSAINFLLKCLSEVHYDDGQLSVSVS